MVYIIFYSQNIILFYKYLSQYRIFIIISFAFFIKYVVSNDIVLIDSANIKKKCILMKIENDCILSPCCYLEEHD